MANTLEADRHPAPPNGQRAVRWFRALSPSSPNEAAAAAQARLPKRHEYVLYAGAFRMAMLSARPAPLLSRPPNGGARAAD